MRQIKMSINSSLNLILPANWWRVASRRIVLLQILSDAYSAGWDRGRHCRCWKFFWNWLWHRRICGRTSTDDRAMPGALTMHWVISPPYIADILQCSTDVGWKIAWPIKKMSNKMNHVRCAKTPMGSNKNMFISEWYRLDTGGNVTLALKSSRYVAEEDGTTCMFLTPTANLIAWWVSHAVKVRGETYKDEQIPFTVDFFTSCFAYFLFD